MENPLGNAVLFLRETLVEARPVVGEWALEGFSGSW